MDYEKKYKESLERARAYKGLQAEMEIIFPELKENGEENIGRKLIAFLKQCKAVYGDGFKQFGLDIDDALAWLEKQGEQKPIGKPTLDIEIPFGMDSELVEETMTIPKGCYAVIEGNKVVIRRGEKPAEWSKEDNDKIYQVLAIVDDYRRFYTIKPSLRKALLKDLDNIEAWLKSLKDRYTWKPSEGQIFALESVIDSHPFANSRTKESLQDLVKQLKAL